MSSRDYILKAIAANRPPAQPLPEIDLSMVTAPADLLESFRTVLGNIGAATVLLSSVDELGAELAEARAQGLRVINLVPGAGDIDPVDPSAEASLLEDIDITCLSGSICVAENGAIWVPEHSMGNRLLPFICTRLMLVVERANIVGTMHDAYGRIDAFADGFGAFIAGPSKTADIEQALVIGAHGAKGLTVYII